MLAIVVVFGLYWLDHRELAYLWLGLICTISLVIVSFVLVQTYTTWMGSHSILVPLVFGVLPPVQIGLWLMFWGYWFRLERTVWLKRVYRCTWVTVVLVAIAGAMQVSPFIGLAVAQHIIAWLSPLADVMTLLFGAPMFWIAYLGIRKTGAEGWMALPAAVLTVLVANTWLLHKLHVRTNYHPFGVITPFARIATLSSLGIIAVLTVRRYLQGSGSASSGSWRWNRRDRCSSCWFRQPLPPHPDFQSRACIFRRSRWVETSSRFCREMTGLY